MQGECLWCHAEVDNQIKFEELFCFCRIKSKKLCLNCEELFEIDENEDKCVQCGRFNCLDNLCGDCLEWNRGNNYKLINTALFPYEDVQDYMEEYKFKGNYRLAEIFSDEFQKRLKQNDGKMIVPIPISKSTMKKRKFNQVEGWLKDIPYQNVLTAKAKKVEPQSAKNKKERMKLQQPFEIAIDKREIIKGEEICLVDDVYTTGTTLHLAADLLIKNGAKKVTSMTLAR